MVAETCYADTGHRFTNVNMDAAKSGRHSSLLDVTVPSDRTILFFTKKNLGEIKWNIKYSQSETQL
ncbi:MAG: hypothetical protein [Microvirus sp.]|nr:MAG: hypothetical protein [Microvirus sp.]